MLKILTFLIPWRTIKKNKARTMMTFVGILLSVILLTTIVILITSYKTSMVATIIKKKGDWHYLKANDYSTEIFDINNELGICENYTLVNEIGYSQIDDIVRVNKPYIHISSLHLMKEGMMSVDILEGRFPKTAAEIMVPLSYAKDYNINIDDLVIFTIGNRIASDTENKLHQNASYLGADNEYITSERRETFIVVGISNTINWIENSFSPGYSLIIASDGEEYTQAYVKLKNPSDCKKSMESYDNSIVYNKDLLDILGITTGEGSGKLLIAIAVVLGLFIFLICFIIINNSFMLSINEKAKDYSLYNSMGMTNRQIVLTIFSEAVLWCILVIPIAILLGIAVVYCFLNLFTKVLASVATSGLSFELNIVPFQLLLVGVISGAMVIISSIIPFFIHKNKFGISGIRENYSIKMKKHKIKKEKKLLNGSINLQIANKSLQRFKGKYIFSVVSIIVSLTLLLNVGSFCKYALAQINEESGKSFDIYCNVDTPTMSNETLQKYNELSNVAGVNDSWWISLGILGTYHTVKSDITDEANSFFELNQINDVEINYLILDEEFYAEVLSSADITSRDRNKVFGFASLPSSEGKSIPIFKNSEINIVVDAEESIKIEILSLAMPQLRFIKNIRDYYLQGGIYILIPENSCEKYFNASPNRPIFYFTADNPSETYERMLALQEQNSWTLSIINYSESFYKELNSVKIIETFAMIFLLIVAFISVLNITNTITQTILLRKREFAIYTSIGIKKDIIQKMALTESLSMFLVAMGISLIVSVLLSFVFKIVFKASFYYFPWSIFLAMNAIYLAVIVIATLLAINMACPNDIVATIKGQNN